MKKLALFLSFSFFASALVFAEPPPHEIYRPICPMPIPDIQAKGRNLVEDIPTLEQPKRIVDGFEVIKNVAQYKQGNWNHAIGLVKNVSRKEALEIANANPEITFFFYTRSHMILETENKDYRAFNKGDAVFFSGEPHWGTAPGMADGYVRVVE